MIVRLSPSDTTHDGHHSQLAGEDTIVVPLSLLPEFRRLPDDTLSFTKFAESVSSQLASLDTRHR